MFCGITFSYRAAPLQEHSGDPTKKDLVAFYHSAETLKIKSAEEDPYSFVFKK